MVNYMYSNKYDFEVEFEWDEDKSQQNIAKHGISFKEACKAFDDPWRCELPDVDHSHHEERYLCFGIVQGTVVTVCYTIRNDRVRIITAGAWEKGRKVYERANQTRR